MTIVTTMTVSPRGPRLSVSVTSVIAIARSNSGTAGVGDGSGDTGEVNWMPGETRATDLLFEAGVFDGEAAEVEPAGWSRGAIKCQSPIAASTRMIPKAATNIKRPGPR